MSTSAENQLSAEPVEFEKKLEGAELSDDKDAGVPSRHSSTAASSLKEKAPWKTPFVDPVPSAKPAVRSELNANQQEKYETVLKTVQSWTEIPSTKGKTGPITDDEIMWLTRECLLRYLRATKWSTAEASKRILGTLTWRRDYGVDGFTADYISPENETGKQVILGYDIAARPCLYLNPGKQNTDPSPRQVQHLVFMLERVIDIAPSGQEQLALLINFKSNKSRKNTSPPLSQGKEVLNILQTHYPERLGRACIINIPWLVSGFFKLITPFIDPLTRQKLVFNEDLRAHVPPEQLSTELGGDVNFVYDHGVYWPALNELCQARRKERRTRWEKAGKRYAESEVYLKGGNPLPEGAAIPQQVAVQDTDPVLSTSPPEAAELSSAPQAQEPTPTRTSGTQANGNLDVAAVNEDPKLTTEGDR
ncbi:MAG: hypothetical protein M1818_003449 [Claussenomyces sp. TS43310]|nr:MAG: hypothetical protein M1818_003449 [Claussenomyces sp. TS43310]